MSSPIKAFRFVNSSGDAVVLDKKNGFISNKPEGIDVVSVTVSIAQGVKQVGASLQDRSIQPRAIVMSGTICGIDQGEKKDRLQAVVRPDLEGTLYADDEWFLNVIVTASPTIGARTRFATYQFQLTAPYPFWQRTKKEGAHLAGVHKQFRFPWNIPGPYRFGTRVAAKFANIVNRGHTDCPLEITFTALDIVMRPSVSNLLTGEALLLDKTIVAGERVVIAITHERTSVISSVEGDCRGALELASTLYRLHPGDNILKPSAESGLDDLDVSIEFATERVGITL